MQVAGKATNKIECRNFRGERLEWWQQHMSHGRRAEELGFNLMMMGGIAKFSCWRGHHRVNNCSPGWAGQSGNQFAARSSPVPGCCSRGCRVSQRAGPVRRVSLAGAALNLCSGEQGLDSACCRDTRLLGVPCASWALPAPPGSCLPGAVGRTQFDEQALPRVFGTILHLQNWSGVTCLWAAIVHMASVVFPDCSVQFLYVPTERLCFSNFHINQKLQDTSVPFFLMKASGLHQLPQQVLQHPVNLNMWNTFFKVLTWSCF